MIKEFSMCAFGKKVLKYEIMFNNVNTFGICGRQRIKF